MNSMKLIDKDGNTYIDCPDGHEYLNNLSIMELVSLTPSTRPDVDNYIFLLIAVRAKVDSGLLELKDTYSIQEFLDSHYCHYDSLTDARKQILAEKLGYI